MKLFSPTLVATTLLVGEVLGIPASGLMDRISARSLNRKSGPLVSTSGGHTGSVQGQRTANTSAVAYSSNWAGAVREAPPPEGTYTAVTATFTVPKPTSTGSANGPEAGSAWVGIDGDTYNTAILQTGVDFYLENGNTYHDAWFEWYPDYAYDFDIQVHTGDVIVAKVEALSNSEGVAIIENETTGMSVTQTISAPAPTATLGGQNAEWIVEDFQTGATMVSLVDFSRVVFSGVEAKAGGKSYGLDGATIIELKQNDIVKTEVVVIGNNDFAVTYRA